MVDVDWIVILLLCRAQPRPVNDALFVYKCLQRSVLSLGHALVTLVMDLTALRWSLFWILLQSTHHVTSCIEAGAF